MRGEKIVLLDVDGVLTDHTQEILNGINDQFYTNWTIDDVSDPHFSFMPKLQREYAYRLWESVSYDNDVLTDDQLTVLRKLAYYARVVVVSSPVVGNTDSKLAFLLRYFSRKDVVIAAEKTLVRGDILVDDSPHNILAFRQDGRKAVVYDRPWNRRLSRPRADNFVELGHVVCEHLGVHLG